MTGGWCLSPVIRLQKSFSVHWTCKKKKKRFETCTRNRLQNWVGEFCTYSWERASFGFVLWYFLQAVHEAISPYIYSTYRICWFPCACITCSFVQSKNHVTFPHEKPLVKIIQHNVKPLTYQGCQVSVLSLRIYKLPVASCSSVNLRWSYWFTPPGFSQSYFQQKVRLHLPAELTKHFPPFYSLPFPHAIWFSPSKRFALLPTNTAFLKSQEPR